MRLQIKDCPWLTMILSGLTCILKSSFMGNNNWSESQQRVVPMSCITQTATKGHCHPLSPKWAMQDGKPTKGQPTWNTNNKNEIYCTTWSPLIFIHWATLCIHLIPGQPGLSDRRTWLIKFLLGDSHGANTVDINNKWWWIMK